MVLKMTVSLGFGDCTRQRLHKGGGWGGNVLYNKDTFKAWGPLDATYTELCTRLASHANFVISSSEARPPPAPPLPPHRDFYINGMPMPGVFKAFAIDNRRNESGTWHKPRRGATEQLFGDQPPD